MQCHSVSINSHQLELSVFPITTSNIEGISERCCLIDVSMCGMLTDYEKQLQRCQEFQVKWHSLMKKLTDI